MAESSELQRNRPDDGPSYSALTETQFRVIEQDEIECGYAVIREAVAWIRERDIDLWRVPLARDAYARRHRAGENFGLFVDGALAAIASLRNDPPADWADGVKGENMRWPSTLATATAFRGRGLGRTAVLEAAAKLGAAGIEALYLDCSPGYLPGFYAALGFEVIDHKARLMERLPGQVREPVPVVLMRKSLEL